MAFYEKGLAWLVVWKASVKWEDDFDGGLGVKEKKVVGIRICRGFVLGVWIDGD